MKLGFALSGGGVRGTAHLGVLKAFEEHGIKPDMIAGTSAGALVAGFYAAGITVEESIQIAKKISWQLFDFSTRGLLKDVLKTGWRYAKGRRPYVRTSGIIPAESFYRFLKSYLGDKKITDLSIPVAITAVDINRGDTIVFTNTALRTKEYVVMRNVLVVDAIRASMAIPVIFTPKIIGRRRLVDGALTNNLPTDIVYSMGANKVIAVNLGYSGQLEDDVDNLFEIGAQAVDIMGYQIARLRQSGRAVVIDPEIYNVGTLDFKKIPECIERGYLAANKILSS